MSTWGPACTTCGHPAEYHGITFCTVDAGGENKRRCDCHGYNVPRFYVSTGWLLEHFTENHPEVGIQRCLDLATTGKEHASA